MTVPKITDLSESINTIVKKFGCSYMDAILHYCEENGVEIENIARSIKQNEKIRSSLQIEAEDLNFWPKTPRLEF